MVKIEINFTNRWLYSFIVIVGILVLGAGVYATTHSSIFLVAPNPGHFGSEIELSSYATVAWVTTNFEPIPSSTTPTNPSGLILLWEFPDIIGMTWLDNSNDETRFEIQRDGSTIVGIVTSGSTQYDDPGLTSGTTYSYRVRACNSASTPCSGWSNTITGTTCVDENNCDDLDR